MTLKVLSSTSSNSRAIPKKSSSNCSWWLFLLLINGLGLGWLYSEYYSNSGGGYAESTGLRDEMSLDPANSMGQISLTELSNRLTSELKNMMPSKEADSAAAPVLTKKEGWTKLVGPGNFSVDQLATVFSRDDTISNLAPVLGPVATNGTKPLFSLQHSGGDAIFALACNYPKEFYQRFCGSLRKSGFTGDIVLAVSPVNKMKPGVEKYLKKLKVISYPFEVDCIGKDNCQLKDEFLGYPDPRPHRTFANIRYALYEHWLQHYNRQSYILILDFRDTFFQSNPFGSFPPIGSRSGEYDLHLFQENAHVKTIGICVYNSLWIGRCFGKPALASLREKPVLCSGSTLGSFIAVKHYVRTMLKAMDTVQCWRRGIESDQGYQK